MKINELFEQEYSTKKLEKIAKSALYSYRYAYEVLERPFPAGEAAIAKSAQYSYEYARYVLGSKPFKAGEAAIATNSYYSYRYAIEILKGPWPAGEAAIVTNSYYSYRYAKGVLEGPFPAGEAMIAKGNRKEYYIEFLESISSNSGTLLFYSIQRLLDKGEKVYLDFKEGKLVQKGLITKIDKNIVYADTDLGIWFVQEDADEHFTLRKVNNKLVVQKV